MLQVEAGEAKSSRQLDDGLADLMNQGRYLCWTISVLSRLEQTRLFYRHWWEFLFLETRKNDGKIYQGCSMVKAGSTSAASRRRSYSRFRHRHRPRHRPRHRHLWSHGTLSLEKTKTHCQRGARNAREERGAPFSDEIGAEEVCACTGAAMFTQEGGTEPESQASTDYTR